MASDFGEVPKLKRKIKPRVIQKEENLQGIRDVIKEVGDENITVEEFVALVSQHTGDRGYGLTKVLTEDLNSFRKMVVKVYETMTQDVSDVLANEQMELAKMYEEKHRVIITKIMKCCKELKEIYPPFTFENYYTDPEKYLQGAFVIPELPEEEEIDTVKRHLAYHRLQWLQGEGERLKAENSKLTRRLAELKRQQREALKQAVRTEVEAEQTHLELTQAEHSMQEKMEDLNQTIHEKILEEEKQEAQQKKLAAKKRGDAKKRAKRAAWGADLTEAGDTEELWNVTAAQQIEAAQLAEHAQSTVGRMTVSATSTKVSPLSEMRLESPEISMRQELIDDLRSMSLRDEVDPCNVCEEKSRYPPGSPQRHHQDLTLTQMKNMGPRRPNRGYGQPPKDSWGGYY